ncbi:hypothetical protein pb186bvf_011852 [Paramecium bursaria]
MVKFLNETIPCTFYYNTICLYQKAKSKKQKIIKQKQIFQKI